MKTIHAEPKALRYTFVVSDISAAQSHNIDFKSLRSNDILLHVAFRASAGKVVVNKNIAGEWGSEISVSRNFSKLSHLSAVVTVGRGGTVSIHLAGENQIDLDFPDGQSILAADDIQFSDSIDCYVSRVPLPEGGADEPIAAQDPRFGARNSASAMLKKGSSLLIVGSAPTVIDHIDRIRGFSGEIWALNDALFWLEKESIKAATLVVADAGFIEKRRAELSKSALQSILILDRTNVDPVPEMGHRIYSIKSLGRDGFSEELGSAYHGYSVFHVAIQCAVALNYRHISTCGVMFPIPSVYERVDGSKRLSEYVHDKQLKNTMIAMQMARSKNVDVRPFESSSNLNFM